jgi:hypothetical protein
MLYDEFYAITSKISITVGWWTKTNFQPSSFVVVTSLLSVIVFLAECAPPQRWTQCQDRVAEGGGVDRGDEGACCKPNRGYLVQRITFSVCFAPPNPLF